MVLAVNICSREAELQNIEKWEARNNLKKSLEIIFTKSRRRCTVCAPSPLTNIHRVTSMKILGITVTNHLSVSEHVHNTVTCRCVQSMHALRILHSHGLPTESLQMIFKAVVIAKFTAMAEHIFVEKKSTGSAHLFRQTAQANTTQLTRKFHTSPGL